MNKLSQLITLYVPVIGIWLCVFSYHAFAIVPIPAPKQTKPIAITEVTAHVGNGEVIENAVITFDEGKITF